MEVKHIQVILSFVFIIAYLTLIFVVLFMETNGSFTIKPNHDSMLGELKILIGVLTAGVGQILNFWFGSQRKTQKDTPTAD